MISVHWIPTHRGTVGDTPDRDVFARWKPPFVKIVCVDERPPYLEDVPAGAKIVVRNHPMSELYGSRGLRAAGMVDAGVDGSDESDVSAKYERYFAVFLAQQRANGYERAGFPGYPVTASAADSPEAVGADHAAACARMAAYCEAKNVPRKRLLFEGLNEPQLWANEPPELVARYYRAFLRGLHVHSLHGVVGNFGVGWPGNGGTGQPPEWAFFKPVIDAFEDGDFLGLHEYWALSGPGQNWTWWAGRFLQCPYQVPILITECGIDTGVTGQWYGGWNDLPGTVDEKARRYIDELWWYGRQCAADGRVKGIFPFTYDIGGKEWEKFDIRSTPLLEEFWRKLESEGLPITDDAGDTDDTDPTPEPEPTPGGEVTVETTYTIVGSVVARAPNAGVAYVNGTCEMVDADGEPVKPMDKVVQARWAGNANEAEWMTVPVGPHYGYEAWAHGFWSFTPAQLDGEWELRAVDDFRGIASPWVAVTLNAALGRQAEMVFYWTPITDGTDDTDDTDGSDDSDGSDAVDVVDRVRKLGWDQLGIPYNPEAAFAVFARKQGLGVPVTTEYEVAPDHRAQGFAGGMVYAKVGDWENVKVVGW